jgi:hypothetical protein
VVVSEFHRVVNETLNAKSFLFHVGGGTIEYQAPNRTRQDDDGGGDVVIGAKTYWSLGTDNGVVRQWGEEPITRLIDELVGPKEIKAALSDLRRQGSVTKRDSGFDIGQVVKASRLFLGDAGQVLVKWSVTLRSQYVHTIKAEAFGIFPSYFISSDRSAPVRSIAVARYSFSNVGDVAPITAPPKDRTVKLKACANHGEFSDSGKYICGMFYS